MDRVIPMPEINEMISTARKRIPTVRIASFKALAQSSERLKSRSMINAGRDLTQTTAGKLLPSPQERTDTGAPHLTTISHQALAAGSAASAASDAPSFPLPL